MESPAAPPLLHILTGCTAVGKTEWALRWAEEKQAEILSCDSLLFYRGMDIGTAKPTREERARVRHHLIDLLDPAEPMDVTRYVALAKATAEDVRARGRAVLVTGGSGFYLRTFFSAVTDDVAVPPAVRAQVDARLRDEGLPALVAELRQLNPKGIGSLDTANPRRVTRALERCLVSGKPLVQLAAEFAAKPAPFAGWDIKLTELVRPPEELRRRFEERVEQMLAAGLIGEVERLRAAGLERNPAAAKAIGYRETFDFLDGRLPRAELAAAITRNTQALVKKQRTWFRTQLPPHRTIDAREASVSGLFEG